jgi:hypothetical protein
MVMRISCRLLVWLIPFLLVVLVGCGPPVGTVSGTVKYNGATVEHGMVSFVSQRTGTIHTSEIKSDGTYEIKGIPYGPARVTVVQLPKDALSPTEFRKKQMLEKTSGEASVPGYKSMLPEKYLRADEDNPLNFEITAPQASYELKLED